MLVAGYGDSGSSVKLCGFESKSSNQEICRTRWSWGVDEGSGLIVFKGSWGFFDRWKGEIGCSKGRYHEATANFAIRKNFPSPAGRPKKWHTFCRISRNITYFSRLIFGLSGSHNLRMRMPPGYRVVGVMRQRRCDINGAGLRV